MVRIAMSPLDIDFRRVVAARLAQARKEVLVVTGEFSAFSNYIELQWAVRDAAARGVRFEIYSNTFLPGPARKLKSWGCILYTGAARSSDHFMVVDGREAVVSLSHPSGSCGDRRGFTTRKGAPGFRAKFRRLARSGRRIQRVHGPDPLDEWLSNPISGVRSDSGSVDDSLV